jgi:hypothetical protein
MRTLKLERLQEVLHYDPETGIFTWLKVKHRTIRPGDEAGRFSPYGYITVKVDQIEYMAHRLAWFYMTGAWPTDQIDHRDRNRANNRWVNLREATNKQNHENIGLSCRNTSGIKGVRWDSQRGKWFAFITHHRRMQNLGRFADLDDAIAARRSAETSLFTHA